MKLCALAIALIAQVFPARASDVKTDALCEPLLAFVTAVQPDETRRLKFHTSWGRNFKDEATQAVWAKRCDHDGYVPAKAVCAYLLEHSSAEFAGYNLKRAMMCLSPEMNFGALSFKHAAISTHYGTEDRGSFVDFELMQNSGDGGTTLIISVNGY